MRFPAKSVVQIFRLLEESGVPVWLDGGWGIDALLKRETREHQDLDLIIPVECLNAAESVLGDVGFLKDDRQTMMPAKFVLRNSEELQIDIHPVTLKPDGSAEHIDSDDTSNFYTFVHSAAGLSGVGVISGQIVRCTTAAEQIRQKAERRYSPWKQGRTRANGISADLEDIITLQQEFGICESRLAQAATAPEAQPTGKRDRQRHGAVLLTSRRAAQCAAFAAHCAACGAHRAAIWSSPRSMRSSPQIVRSSMRCGRRLHGG